MENFKFYGHGWYDRETKKEAYNCVKKEAAYGNIRFGWYFREGL